MTARVGIEEEWSRSLAIFPPSSHCNSPTVFRLTGLAVRLELWGQPLSNIHTWVHYICLSIELHWMSQFRLLLCVANATAVEQFPVTDFFAHRRLAEAVTMRCALSPRGERGWKHVTGVDIVFSQHFAWKQQCVSVATRRSFLQVHSVESSNTQITLSGHENMITKKNQCVVIIVTRTQTQLKMMRRVHCITTVLAWSWGDMFPCMEPLKWVYFPSDPFRNFSFSILV